MIQSIETRWFLPFEPFPVTDFFTDTTEPRTRTDWYAFPCDERSGTKTREGKLEIKLRTGELEKVTFRAATGIVEEWQKWSVAFEKGDIPPDNKLASSGWLPVEKTRYLKIFEIEGSSIKELNQPVNCWPENGGQFEWTQLRVDGEPWWTVGVEAFGHQSQLRDNLQVVADHLFSASEQLSCLKADNSFSYPRLLQEITR